MVPQLYKECGQQLHTLNIHVIGSVHIFIFITKQLKGGKDHHQLSKKNPMKDTIQDK